MKINMLTCITTRNLSYFCLQKCRIFAIITKKQWRYPMPRETLKNRIARKISNSRKTVFMRKDFKKLADYDQVGRALKELTREDKLIKTA